MECPRCHRASIRQLIKWRVTKLYGAQWRRRQQRCREDCVFWEFDKTGSSETANAPTPPMWAPGALAPRFWGNASANHMSVKSSRKQSPPNQMARHRTLRREMASASAKLPLRLYILGLARQEVQRDRMRRHRLCRRQEALQGASRASRPQVMCP